ncbi:MAG: ERAD-associated protein [Sclerophora amabilis]|nr:MAG: ERAD-associated protein [Sclerophora amabilis]
MKLGLWRLVPLTFFVLPAVIAAIQVQEQEVLASERSNDGNDLGNKVKAVAEADVAEAWSNSRAGGRNDHERGAVLVQQALEILRNLERSRSTVGRLDRPSGLFATAAYYTKELFVLLFMNGPPQEERLETQNPHQTLSRPLASAVRLLHEATQHRNADALYLLAEMNFHGQYSLPRNYTEAFQRYKDLVSLDGNSTAQHMIGFMYATGIGGAVDQDQAKALLYHTFAALGGNTKSEMTVAFRHHSGIGTPRNCDEASFYYKNVADKAIKYWRSGPPGGQWMMRDAYRLADDEGGVYGEGASVVSSGVNAVQGGPNSDTHAAFDDVLEYLDLMSRKGELKATYRLGILYYEGSRPMKRNLKQAKIHFMSVAKKHWPREVKASGGGTPGLEKLASKAAGYLGRMFLRGEGMEQNFAKAKTWFQRGIENGDAVSQYYMGLMHLNGLGYPKDAIRAADYFKSSAEQDYAPARTSLGALLLDQGDVGVAIRYFELASRYGNTEAFYYLAEIMNQGIGRDRSCGMATAYYKIVAERAESIHTPFASTNQAYEDGDIETALVGYMMAAEQGYEAGQANVAYLLDEEKSRLRLRSLLPFGKPKPSILRSPGLALIYWTRSAKQSNIDSLVKMGDYYLDGVGTTADDDKAATCYQSAAEFQQSAQALWNLGWMHENGIGVDQDFHLAKRLYDLSLETNEEAYLPVSLSLLKLRMRSFWNTITNGRINSIREEPEPKKDWSFREWINNFLQDDQAYADEFDDDDDDATDPIRDTIRGEDDFYEIDDGIIESFIIVGLAAALAFLVYYRQQRQLNHQRAMQNEQAAAAVRPPNGAPQQAGQPEQPQQGGDRGFFPQPGDPEFGQWVAGGAFH